MIEQFERDVAAVQRLADIPTILDTVCRLTGMGFAAVARVTPDHWVACSVDDRINFGLTAGGELKIETTICHEIRMSRAPVIIDDVDADPVYRSHQIAEAHDGVLSVASNADATTFTLKMPID